MLGTCRQSGRLFWLLFEVWPAPGVREGLQKHTPTNPARLPSGTQIWNEIISELESPVAESRVQKMGYQVPSRARTQAQTLKVYHCWFASHKSRRPRNGQGGYYRFFEIGFCIGFGQFDTINLIQTLSKTYLGGARYRF